MKSLELRREKKTLAVARVVHRLLAETVARQQERPLAPIPESDREHARDAAKGFFDSPSHAGGEHDFRVRAAAKAVAEALELFLELEKVVDLAVEDDDEAAVARAHRLVTRW